MSGITSKYTSGLAFILLLLMNSHQLDCQEGRGYRSLMLTIGGGYGHYFNTFSNVLDKDISNNRPSFYARLMWQPEHLVGIGFESGYYEFYSTTRIETGSSSEKLTTNLNVIPLFISFSVRATKHLKADFATGGALMEYTVLKNKSRNGSVTGTTLSMSDFAAGVGWYTPVGKRFQLGADVRYMYIGKTADSHISVSINLSWMIINRKTGT
jgi:hypothetical protein